MTRPRDRQGRPARDSPSTRRGEPGPRTTPRVPRAALGVARRSWIPVHRRRGRAPGGCLPRPPKGVGGVRPRFPGGPARVRLAPRPDEGRRLLSISAGRRGRPCHRYGYAALPTLSDGARGSEAEPRNRRYPAHSPGNDSAIAARARRSLRPKRLTASRPRASRSTMSPWAVGLAITTTMWTPSLPSLRRIARLERGQADVEGDAADVDAPAPRARKTPSVKCRPAVGAAMAPSFLAKTV